MMLVLLSELFAPRGSSLHSGMHGDVSSTPQMLMEQSRAGAHQRRAAAPSPVASRVPWGSQHKRDTCPITYC